jgi:hypothetical protein
MRSSGVRAVQRRMAAGLAVLPMLIGLASHATEADRPAAQSAVARFVQRWAQSGDGGSATLACVDLSKAAQGPLAWRFLRIIASDDQVQLVAVASHATTLADCRIERRHLAESPKAVAAILAASAQALALPQDASAPGQGVDQRYVLVFTDGCAETSRTFAGALSPELNALFAQWGALMDLVLRDGTVAVDDRGTGRPIGHATMKEDGLLVLNLSAESPRGDHGLASFRYRVTDSDYAATLVHVGGICPGRAGRIVPPWPDCGR